MSYTFYYNEMAWKQCLQDSHVVFYGHDTEYRQTERVRETERREREGERVFIVSEKEAESMYVYRKRV